jgi:hypothetical protein
MNTAQGDGDAATSTNASVLIQRNEKPYKQEGLVDTLLR